MMIVLEFLFGWKGKQKTTNKQTKKQTNNSPIILRALCLPPSLSPSLEPDSARRLLDDFQPPEFLNGVTEESGGAVHTHPIPQFFLGPANSGSPLHVRARLQFSFFNGS